MTEIIMLSVNAGLNPCCLKIFFNPFVTVIREIANPAKKM